MLRYALLAAASLLLTATPSLARTWYITPDGTGDAPTIQAGVDSSAAGDTVEVACGTYYEHGIVAHVPLTLRSELDFPSAGPVFLSDNTPPLSNWALFHYRINHRIPARSQRTVRQVHV